MYEVDKLGPISFLLPQVELEVWPLRHATTPPHAPKPTPLTPQNLIESACIAACVFLNKRHLLHGNWGAGLRR